MRQVPTSASRWRRRSIALAVATVCSVGILALPTAQSAPLAGVVAVPTRTIIYGPVDGAAATVSDGSVSVDGASPPSAALAGEIDGVSSAAFSPPANTDFILNFDGSVDSASRTVINAAAGIWSAVLHVSVPISVDVSMMSMPSGMLGSGGATNAYYGRPYFPSQNVLYPSALANQYAMSDLSPGVGDIGLDLSSSISWDKRIDGTVAANGQSMLSVALHEIGHGLGHSSWARTEGGALVVNYLINGVSMATGYDRLVTDGGGTPITSAVSSLLGSLLTSPLYWNGSAGKAAVGGSRPRLYSPSSYQAGSSVGHLDEATYGSNLMTPYINRGEVHTSISPLTLGIISDLGWTMAGSGGSSMNSRKATSFVSAVVYDFLRRHATANEKSYWSGYLANGGDRAYVAKRFAYTDEWIGVIVDGLYQSTLGRGPDSSGRSYWISVIKNGATPASVAASFYASDEYYLRSGSTAASWIRDLYSEILHRQADSGGLQYWISRTRSSSRQAVAFEIYQSVESRRDRVKSLYQRLLGRLPDSAGWSYWADVLSDGRDVELAISLGSSTEYAQRSAQRFPA